MRIGRDPLRQILLAIVAAPHLRPAEEETLIAGQPANHRRFLAAERLLVGVISDGQAGEIADILTQREGAIELRSEEHTSELQSLMRLSYAVFCLKKKNTIT